jgi:hypothetical protein
MAITQAFNPADTVVTIGHVTVSNLSEDDAVVIERRSDGMQFAVGLDGKVAPTLSADQTATIKISVLATSDTHKALQALTGYGTPALSTASIPITVIDKGSGARLALAPVCYLSKGPGLNISKSLSSRTWEFLAESVITSF